MDIVVKGRNVEVPEHYREHVATKLARLERYDRKTIRADVELHHEPNPRQAKNCQRLEITLKSRGPAVRAEASAGDFYAALDCAVSKLESRLRKLHDRRKVHHGLRNPTSLAEAAARAEVANGAMVDVGRSAAGTTVLEAPSEREQAGVEEIETGPAASDVPEQRYDADGHEPGRIVREKVHPSDPMTVDQALYEMELVGHDFYLFSDADTGRPSVVYRRKGFDYGVIRLAR